MAVPAGYTYNSGGYWRESDGSGPYHITSDGLVIRASDWEYLLAVGFGQVPGHRRITALGNKPDLSSTAPADVWTGGGDYPWMENATSLEVVSDSAQDTPTGTGASQITLGLLDANYNEIASTIVTLNGLAPVAIPVQAFRINSARVSGKGSGGSRWRAKNAGNITIRDAGGGTVRAIIPAGKSTLRQSAYTVPAGHTLQIISQLFCANRLTAAGFFATFTTVIQAPTGITLEPFDITIGDEPPYRHDGSPGIVLVEKTDFCHRQNFASASRDVTAGWLGILKMNTSP